MVGLIYAMKFTTSNFLETSGGPHTCCAYAPNVGSIGGMVYFPNMIVSLVFIGIKVGKYTIYIPGSYGGSSIEAYFFRK